MDKVIQSSENKIPKKRDWYLPDLRSNFQNTVKFKQTIHSILIFNHGYIEMYYQYQYNITITDQIISYINTTEIDNFIGKIIDTLGKTVSKETLVNDFNYPVEDVYIVDLDNW